MQNHLEVIPSKTPPQFRNLMLYGAEWLKKQIVK